MDAAAHPQLLKQFKSKTRVPWAVFQELLREMSADPDMQERKHVSIPLSLKLCAALRYLATGHSFSGMEDGFQISAQVQRDFFWQKFVPWMMKNKYDETVRAPRSRDQLAATVHEYEEVGFPGCCGSVDGTHVAWYVPGQTTLPPTERLCVRLCRWLGWVAHTCGHANTPVV